MKRDIGELLVENGQITDEELKHALQETEKTAEPIGTVLLRLGLINEDNLKTVLELNYGVNYLDLKKTTPDPNIIALLPRDVALEYMIVPACRAGNRLTLAMVTPSDNDGIEKAKGYLKDWQLHAAVCSDDGFQDFVKRAYKPGTIEGNKTKEVEFIELASGQPADLVFDEALTEAVKEDRAIVLLSQHILSNAINRGCTNIHIEPNERQVLVHYRKEGVLFSARKLPKAILPELVERFKTMAANVGVRPTLPYDGRLNVRHNQRKFSFRISIVPGIYGEHLVIWLE